MVDLFGLRRVATDCSFVRQCWTVCVACGSERCGAFSALRAECRFLHPLGRALHRLRHGHSHGRPKERHCGLCGCFSYRRRFSGDTVSWQRARSFGCSRLLHGATPWSVLFDHVEASFDARRLAATTADLGSLLLAPSLLRAAGLPIGAALVHGWNPFIVKEVAGSGRLDAVALFFLIAALRLAQTPRFKGAAAVAYGLSLNGPLMLAGSLPLMGRALRNWVAPALIIGVFGWTLTFPGSWLMRAGWPPENSLGRKPHAWPSDTGGTPLDPPSNDNALRNPGALAHLVSSDGHAIA